MTFPAMCCFFQILQYFYSGSKIIDQGQVYKEKILNISQSPENLFILIPDLYSTLSSGPLILPSPCLPALAFLVPIPSQAGAIGHC